MLTWIKDMKWMKQILELYKQINNNRTTTWHSWEVRYMPTMVLFVRQSASTHYTPWLHLTKQPPLLVTSKWDTSLQQSYSWGDLLANKFKQASKMNVMTHGLEKRSEMGKLKILNFRNKVSGASTPVGFPLIPHQWKWYPGPLTWRVLEMNKRAL